MAKKTAKRKANARVKVPASLKKYFRGQKERVEKAYAAMGGVYDPALGRSKKRLTPNDRLRAELAAAKAATARVEQELAAYKHAVHLDLPPTPPDLVPPGRDYAVGGTVPLTNDDKLGINRTIGFATEGGQLAIIPVVPFSVFQPENFAYSSTFARMVDEELTRARAVWGPEHNQNSLHESYAVILEEVDEFWDEVKAKQSTPGRADRALKELVQIAAMCRRCAEDVLKVGVE